MPTECEKPRARCAVRRSSSLIVHNSSLLVIPCSSVVKMLPIRMGQFPRTPPSCTPPRVLKPQACSVTRVHKPTSNFRAHPGDWLRAKNRHSQTNKPNRSVPVPLRRALTPMYQTTSYFRAHPRRPPSFDRAPKRSNTTRRKRAARTIFAHTPRSPSQRLSNGPMTTDNSLNLLFSPKPSH
jgi:hypothetical protein